MAERISLTTGPGSTASRRVTLPNHVDGSRHTPASSCKPRRYHLAHIGPCAGESRVEICDSSRWRWKALGTNVKNRAQTSRYRRPLRSVSFGACSYGAIAMPVGWLSPVLIPASVADGTMSPSLPAA